MLSFWMNTNIFLEDRVFPFRLICLYCKAISYSMKEFLNQIPLSTIVGFCAGILTAISMIPQLIKTLKEKKAEDVSPVMLLVLISGVILWIVYGFLKMDWPILVTNILSLLLNVWMFFLRKKYKTSS